MCYWVAAADDDTAATADGASATAADADASGSAADAVSGNELQMHVCCPFQSVNIASTAIRTE